MGEPVLLHGFTGSSASWGDPVLDGLASALGPPVLLDLPGHGRHAGEMDPARFTLAAVFAAIDAAGGPEPFDLVGYSMGGRMALAYAVERPGRVRRLVLESASPGLTTETERARRRAADEVTATALERDGIGRFVERWEALPIFASQRRLPQEVLASQRARRLRNDPASLAASLRGLGTGSQPSYWDELPRLAIPVMLLVGSLDSKFVDIAGEMVLGLPDAHPVEVTNAGHCVHLERPDAWVEAVAGYLSD